MIRGQNIYSPVQELFAGAPPDPLVINRQLVTIDATSVPLPADTLLLDDPFTLGPGEYLVRVAVYLQGDPAATVEQRLRGVIYTSNGIVLAGDEVMIAPGMPATWVTLGFPTEGRALAAGTYRIGLHAGPADGSARYFLSDSPGARTSYAAVYADGPPPSLPSGTGSDQPVVLFLETISPIEVPTNVTDDYLATLPFDVTQRVFTAAGVIASTRVTATTGWYGTTFDPTNGANAIVRSDGPLADLVGERILVSRRGTTDPRSVAVYVHDERTFPDELPGEDLVLSARAFLAIGDQTLDDLDVDVAVLG